MDSDVQRIKDKTNIADVVGQYVQLKKAGRNFTARCPFHKEKTPSFYVSPERGTYICFGCGEKGDIFSFIQKMDGLDFPTTLKQLADKAGVTLSKQPPQRTPEQKGKEARLHEVVEAAAKFFEAELAKRADVGAYIKTRGLHDDTRASWRLGYAPATWDQLSKELVAQGFSRDELVDAGLAVRSPKRSGEVFDRFRGRVMFPLFDATGSVIAYSGRFFEKVPGSKDEGEPAKYINSPETLIFKKSRVLYGLDRARNAIRKADCILLVEGQFDLLMSHQSGLPFAVALSGTAQTDEHLTLLGRLSKRLVLALDADQAGVRAGLRSTHMALKAGFEVKIPTFPEGKDPADVARENPELLKAAVRTSQSAVEFFLEVLKVGSKDSRAYQRAVEAQVLPLIAAMHSSIEQDHFIRIVSSKIGASEAAVRAEVMKLPKVALPALEEAPAPELGVWDALDKKAGMILFYFAPTDEHRVRLQEILGEEKVKELLQILEPHSEALRFSFERELGEHTTARRIAEDMLDDLQRATERERLKMRFT